MGALITGLIIVMVTILLIVFEILKFDKKQIQW